MSPTPHRADACPDGARHRSFLEPGETCWRIDHTPRFGMVVDCDAYFAAFREACLQARHRIFLVGWDFDTRIRMLMDDPDDGWPIKVGPFITELVRRRRGLNIYVLKWDVAFFTMIRQNPWPGRALRWKMSDRVHLKLDGEHPFGSCHHQKIVCIDDRFAMVGAIDITRERWDTRAHLDKDPRRRTPAGRRYGPHHDAALAVEGAAARSLEELCRQRWQRGTGQRLDPPSRAKHTDEAMDWPSALRVITGDLNCGIARTMPPYEAEPGIFEIEALYLRAIRLARRRIYIENQYFAGRAVGRAIAERLKEDDPPEIVVVNPRSAAGWLEEKAMGTARARVAALCRRNDHADRFRLYCPVTENGADIYVHAKIIIIDDRFLKVGSANINNRSMGFDTECDVALEADADDTELRRTIEDQMLDLLAEHLDVAPRRLREAMEAHGDRLIPTVDALRRERGRSLRVLHLEKPEDLDAADNMMVDTQVGDPERPEKPLRRIGRKLRSLIPWAGA